MSSIKCPCKDCEKRHENCHSDCEGYLSFKKDKGDYDSMIRRKKYKESLFNKNPSKRRVYYE